MKKAKPWDENWIIGTLLGEGGQGKTFNATRKNNGTSHFAIKFLKSQKDSERRGRMYVETTVLKVLNHNSIPRVVDSNELDYDKADVDLFLVTEFINGSNLSDFVNNRGVFPLESGLEMTIRLCEILSYCHHKGFIHRDIKPDNIILRDGNVGDPVLIDFGLSFNEDISASKEETPSWKHIGNRFLSLPELRVSEGSKRDSRSDLTMLCGVFLFCLVGIHPTDLIDHNQDKPHRRVKVRDVLRSIAGFRYSALNKFFDIAFNIDINQRYQSVNAIEIALKDILTMQEIEESSSSINERLELLKTKIESSPDFTNSKTLETVFNKFRASIDNAERSVSTLLESYGIQRLQWGFNQDLTNQTFEYGLGFKSPHIQQLYYLPKYSAYANGSEVVFELVEKGRNLEVLEFGRRVELARFRLSDDFDWDRLERKIADNSIARLTEVEI